MEAICAAAGAVDQEGVRMRAIAKSSKKLVCASVVALIAIVSAPGCSSGDEGPLGEAASAIPNPASVYCESQGYRLVIVNGPGGQYGVCVFPDGSSCEEWSFYRGECGQRYRRRGRH